MVRSIKEPVNCHYGDRKCKKMMSQSPRQSHQMSLRVVKKVSGFISKTPPKLNLDLKIEYSTRYLKKLNLFHNVHVAKFHGKTIVDVL